jgi:hypothetical protein
MIEISNFPREISGFQRFFFAKKLPQYKVRAGVIFNFKELQLKNIILFVSLVLVGLTSSAFAGSPVVCRYENRPVYCRDGVRVWVCGSRIVRVCDGGCAPEVQNGNISAVQNTLSTLAGSPAFAGATQFQTQVAAIAAETDTQVKFGDYMNLVGMTNDPTTDDLMNFLGARTADPTAVASLQKNLNLSADQATAVVNGVTTALKGNLQ